MRHVEPRRVWTSLTTKHYLSGTHGQVRRGGLSCMRALIYGLHITKLMIPPPVSVCVCDYSCRTYDQAVRVGGGG